MLGAGGAPKPPPERPAPERGPNRPFLDLLAGLPGSPPERRFRPGGGRRGAARSRRPAKKPANGRASREDGFPSQHLTAFTPRTEQKRKTA